MFSLILIFLNLHFNLSQIFYFGFVAQCIPIPYFILVCSLQVWKHAPEHWSASYSPQATSCPMRVLYRPLVKSGYYIFLIIENITKNNYFVTLDNDTNSNFKVHKKSFIGTQACSYIYVLSTAFHSTKAELLDGPQNIEY